MTESRRVGWLGAMRAAVLATLGRGRWWLLALAAFLLRGGLLLLIPPLIVLPTPAEVASLVPPSVSGTGLANPTPTLVTLLVGGILVVLALLVVTTVIGTWLDLNLVEATAADDELDVLGPSGEARRIPLDAAIEARLAAHIPTAVAVGVGLVALGNAVTPALLVPDRDTPLVLRLLLQAPLATGGIVLAWLVGEAWGGLAVRRLATTRSTLAALRRGLVDMVRPGGLATLVLTTFVVALPVAALWLSSGRAFDRLWPVLVESSDVSIVLLALGLLVGTWGAGLWLLGIALAWRSAAWTAEVLRRT